MSEEKMYKEYFAIDPKYYAAVTAELIRKGEVKWNALLSARNVRPAA